MSSREDQFDYLFKIVIIGDSGVGKTNLLSRFVDNTFSIDSKPTIGVEFAVKTHSIDGKIIKNQIWDTAGQERFRAITNAYYRGAQGAVVVYDVTKSRTFENIGKWLSELRENAEPNISIMLLGNKSDLQNRDVKREAIQDFVKENNLLYLETSALSGQNVNSAFNSLMEEIYEKTKQTPEQTPQPEVKPEPPKKNPIQKPDEVAKPKDQRIKLEPVGKNDSKKKKKDGCCK